MLYLHEIIDIIGDGQDAYLQTVAERARHSEPAGISRLMGCWRVIGSTNRWPRVVNLWEMDGWEQWAGSLERQFLPARRDPHLGPWWSAATQWRSGGFDRILEPTAYSPTRKNLETLGLRSWVCVHTLVRLACGERAKYLRLVGEMLRPCLESRGLTLLGAYSVPMRSAEALVIWAAPSFAHLCRLYGRRHEDRELSQWTARVSRLREAFETMWLVPSPQTFFHPERVD
jgi:hypothetical protein